MAILRWAKVGAVIAGGGYGAWLLFGWGGQAVLRVLDDVGLVVFALVAAVCAGWAAASLGGRDRVAWICVAGAAGAWGLGEALWSYYDLWADETPFPSWADAGYLLFPVGVGVGLIVMLTASATGTQMRVLLDGLIVSAAVFGASWVTLLHTVYVGHAENVVSVAMSLAYPVVDIALITVASLMLLRVPAARRPQLALLTAGLALIAVSDTAFAYLSATDSYQEDHVIALGWAWGFLCIALAALAARRARRSASDDVATSPPRVSGWLPYVPVLLSVLLCTPILVAGLGPVFVALAVSLLALIVRQYLVLAENRRLRAEVASQALRDPTTGLANRTLFEDRLDHAMQLHRRHGLTVAALLISLEQEAAEDLPADLPSRIAERLAATVRLGDTVARFGDGEFAVLMVGDADAIRAAAQLVVAALRRPFVFDGRELRVRPSVGLAATAVDGTVDSAEDLLEQADAAMRRAARSRSAQLCTSAAGSPRSTELLDELRHAIEHVELSVVYQPKFDLCSHQIVGLEALIRWPHSRCGVLGPDQFLPLVREHGLMRSLTTMVLELALDDAARWYEMGIRIPVAVNVFAPAVSDPDVCAQITRALDQRRLPSEALTVEITEDLLLDTEGTTRSVLNKLRDKGIRVAIDDFGSGYSALWYLREFPVDEIKLDREFIAPILTNRASAAIVRAVIDLAHALDVTPVAEGVENAETAARLLEYGCDVGQGFHHSPPLPAEQVSEMLLAQLRDCALARER